MMRKIRKIAAFIVAGLIPFAGHAERVSLEKARQAATTIFGVEAQTKGVVPAELELVYQGSEESLTEPPFYVFNNPKGGFVMIAGDTQSTPVLAYSEEDSFYEGELPSNIKAWMENIESHIDYLRSTGTVDNAATPKKWEQLYNGNLRFADPVIEMETPKWNQGAPYNTYCAGKYTGCVATAMAEIMWYWKWPDAGVGTLDGYTYTDDSEKKVHVDGHELGHEYHWSEMPATIGKGYQMTRGIEDIAKLMKDCGVMVKAMYESDGTGAYSNNVAPAVVEHMKYDAGINFLFAPWFGTDEWLDILYKELDSMRPVYYSASSKDGSGHAFVLDGYASDCTFHINFGWGGSSNGYYVFPSFSEFSENHDMIINMKPDEGGKPVEMMLQYDVEVQDESGKVAKGFDPGVNYKYRAAVYNLGQNPYCGRFAVAVYDHDDVLKCYVSDTTNVDENRIEDLDEARIIIDFTLAEEPQIGDKLRLLYCGDNNLDWRRCIYYEGENYDVFLGDSTFIDESTRLYFVKSTGVINIDTKYGVELSLIGSDGIDYASEAVTQESPSQFMIDITKLRKEESYTLLLKKKDDSKQITIKL